MSALDLYLARYYLNAEQVAAAGGLDVETVDAMIVNRLVPAPSYVVDDTGSLSSFVFGTMGADGARPGRYFHPAQLVWIARARAVLAITPAYEAEALLKSQFCAGFAVALATLNLSTWRLADSFDDSGAPLAAGLQVRVDSAWTYFLNGTFSLCVANPISEAHIGYKEVLQEKLAQQSDNGTRRMFSAQQASALDVLIDAYAAAAMPFSPLDYAVSSRKRLVEDLRANLRVTETVAD